MIKYAENLFNALERIEKEYGKNIPVNLAYAEALIVAREAVREAYEEAAEVAKRRGKWETASQIRALKDSLVQQSDVDGARH